MQYQKYFRVIIFISKELSHGTYCVLTLIIFLLNSPSLADDCSTKQKQPSINNFSIVIDRSGSMSGKAITDAKKSVKHFIDELRNNDRANVITFNNTVSMLSDLRNDKDRLKSVVESINVGGATHLYDAIARASSSLRAIQGSKIIIFLTDGDDTGSKFSISDIKSMNLSEGIFIYGVGLGKVDKSSLDDLSNATNGTYFTAERSGQLYNIYDKVIQAYYNNYGNNLSTTASMTVRSLPSGNNVIINGKFKGKTPLKLESLKPGMNNVSVEFKRGDWSCNTKLETGYRTIIDARESDIGHDVFVSSTPFGASVFLDGNYIGDTPISNSSQKKKKGLFRKKDDWSYSNNLRIPLVPIGKHKLKVIAVPEMEMGFEYEFEFSVKNRERYVHINLFDLNHNFKNGEKGKKSKDHFDVFDVENGNSSSDPFKELEGF